MARGIASQFIELKRDDWVTLPPHADCLVLVVKSGGLSGTSNYVIDLKNSPDPAIPYANMATLACFGYDLDSGTDPDWVRIYYRTNK
jgi:hypothetical protein